VAKKIKKKRREGAVYPPKLLASTCAWAKKGKEGRGPRLKEIKK